jgi:hypothetical protein
MEELREVLNFSVLPDVSQEHPELPAEDHWYPAHMRALEAAYLYVFGGCEPPGQILSPSQTDLMATWPGGGVYQYPPRGRRSAWHYATFGLSQPFSEKEARAAETEADPVAGLGIELVMSATEPQVWAPNILLELVRYLFFAEDASVFVAGERIPFAGFQQLGFPTPLTHLLVVTSADYPCELMLPGGHCTLIHLVGVTDAEIARAREHGDNALGSFVLANVLQELGVGFVTDPGRDCATEHPLFDDVWSEVTAKLQGGQPS